MAHQTLKNSYSQFADRLNRFPQGAPPTELLFKILKVLIKEDEAGLLAQIPVKPFTAEKAARIWKKPLSENRSSGIICPLHGFKFIPYPFNPLSVDP